MNNIKLRAALFTMMVFIVFATIIATLILAQHYQGTDELKYAVLAACFGWIGYVIYRIKLDQLEADDATFHRILKNYNKAKNKA